LELSFGWRRGSGLERFGFGWSRLRSRWIKAVFKEGSDVVLDCLKLVELQVRVDNRENVARNRMLVNKNALAIADNLLFDLEKALAFEHDRENVAGGNVLRIVQLYQFAQKGLGRFFLNGFIWRWRGLVNAMPIRDEPFALARSVAVLLLPARLADVGTPKCGFLVEQQRVIRLFMGEMFAACFASVPAGLNIPLGHERSLNGRVFQHMIA